MSDTKRRLPFLYGYAQRVESLVEDRMKIDFEASAASLRELFLRHEGVVALPVTQRERPVGWVRLHDVIATPIAGASAGALMRHGCETIDSNATVADLLRDLRDGRIEVTDAGLVVIDESGCYLGRIGLVTLLRFVAGIKASPDAGNAHLHNLTGGLPGKPALLARTQQLLREKSLFVGASLDIRGFNAFNDRYGYARGDEVIRFVSGLLRRHLDAELDFVAYLGGDNFTVLLRSMDWFERCEAILQDCEAQAPGFYDADDRRNGGIEHYNHLGERMFTPIFSLSIGVTQVEPGKFRDQHSLLKAVRELKVRAANGGGNAIFVEGLSGPAMDGVFGIVHH